MAPLPHFVIWSGKWDTSTVQMKSFLDALASLRPHRPRIATDNLRIQTWTFLKNIVPLTMFLEVMQQGQV